MCYFEIPLPPKHFGPLLARFAHTDPERCAELINTLVPGAIPPRPEVEDEDFSTSEHRPVTPRQHWTSWLEHRAFTALVRAAWLEGGGPDEDPVICRAPLPNHAAWDAAWARFEAEVTPASDAAYAAYYGRSPAQARR